MSTDPWYKNGLRFECTQCGKCCSGSPGNVWVEDEEVALMANHFNISKKIFIRRYTKKREGKLSLVETKKDYACIFLKDNRCSIYDIRPKQCRTFPWWKETVKTEESWKAASLYCEGIKDEAPLIPFEVFGKFL